MLTWNGQCVIATMWGEKMKQGRKEPAVPLDEFKHIKHREGTINKYVVICTNCRNDFFFFFVPPKP